MKVDFSGDYLNAENAKDGDIFVFLNDGETATIEKDGKEKNVINFLVEGNGKRKTYTPSRESGKRLVNAWGEETVAWKGKKFQIKIVNYKSFGETKQAVEAFPLEEKIKPK